MAQNQNKEQDIKLKRNIGLLAIILYGVGDILGAGVYGLIGRAAAEMGYAVWLAFLVSMIAAGLTGLSYAALSSQFDKAGGASYFTFKAFQQPFFAYIIGMSAFASGLTSMATASRVFAGYMNGIFPFLSIPIIIFLFGILLALIVFAGIKESLIINGICTVVEVCGLLLIIFIGLPYWGSVNYLDATTAANPQGVLGFSMLLSAAVLTFYSFIGFEDVINISEETKDPKKNIPRGILIAVFISSIIYLCISISAVSILPPLILAESTQPLVDVVQKAAPWFPPMVFGIIALFAVSNTALLNYIMGSRLVYGMSRQNLLPRQLGRIHKKTQTPHIAILTIFVIFVSLGLIGDVSSLARATSVLLLTCFISVNLALWNIQRKELELGGMKLPQAIPLLGALICFLMVTQAKIAELLLAGAMILGIALMYYFLKPPQENILHIE